MPKRTRLSLPEPAALRRLEAAEFVGLSPVSFDRAVEAGRLPQPVRLGARSLVWSTDALRRAVDRGADAGHASASNPATEDSECHADQVFG